MSTNYKFILISIVALTGMLFLTASCNEDDSSENSTPTCVIVSPQSGDIFTHGETIVITVDIVDENNTIDYVKLSINDEIVETLSEPPYIFEWDSGDVNPEEVVLRATACDNIQNEYSDEISIELEREFPGGYVTDVDGNEYLTVFIGDQEWMTENLRTKTYNDGTPITYEYTNDGWHNNTTGAYCWNDNNEAYYAETYGALYNWYAVNTGKLCPDGWHVPTDEEWKTLEIYVGMSAVSADSTNWRGTNEGSKLAGKADLWWPGVLNTNPEFGTSGFSAIAGGSRISLGEYATNVEERAYYWTSTEYDENDAWYRSIYWNETRVRRLHHYKLEGRSVRCIKN